MSGTPLSERTRATLSLATIATLLAGAAVTSWRAANAYRDLADQVRAVGAENAELRRALADGIVTRSNLLTELRVSLALRHVELASECPAFVVRGRQTVRCTLTWPDEHQR